MVRTSECTYAGEYVVLGSWKHDSGFQDLCKRLRERFSGDGIQKVAVPSGFNNIIRSSLLSINKTKPQDLYMALFKNASTFSLSRKIKLHTLIKLQEFTKTLVFQAV